MALSALKKKWEANGVATRAPRKGSADETDEAQFLRQISEQIDAVKNAIHTGEEPTTTKKGVSKKGWTRGHWVAPLNDKYFVRIGFPAIAIVGDKKELPVATLKEALEVLEECKAELPKDKDFMKAWGTQRVKRSSALAAGRKK